MSDLSVPNSTPQHNPSVEPFDPWALRADLTDRELLAIFVTSLDGYAFIDFIADGVDNLWGTDDHGDLCAQLHILREALRLAAQRGAGEGGSDG